VLNSQETDRGSASSNVDDRTFHELYLPPFAAAVDAGVGSVMCSYNRIGDVYSCENEATLSYLKSKTGLGAWRRGRRSVFLRLMPPKFHLCVPSATASPPRFRRLRHVGLGGDAFHGAVGHGRSRPGGEGHVDAGVHEGRGNADAGVHEGVGDSVRRR